MDDVDLQPWEVLNAQEVFSGTPWLRVWVDRLQLPSGNVVDEYYRVEVQNYAVMFVQTLSGKVVVERMYKHGVGRVTVALPAGIIEEGEDPLKAARRELIEETGYEAEDWRLLGTFVGNGNYGCGTAYLYSARGGRKVSEPASGDLEDIKVLLMSPSDLLTALRLGEVKVQSSAAAIALATHPAFA